MNAFDFHATSLDGQPVGLDRYRGKVLLVVNTASACGFTPQYGALEALQRRYGDAGLVVLGFPSNQFGHQEPGSEAEIGAFCARNYGVTFPMFSKIEVNGPDAHPLYRFLKDGAPGVLGTKAVKWNFTKFLVARDGAVFRRYAPATRPDQLGADIEALLAG